MSNIRILRYHNTRTPELEHEINQLLADGYSLHGEMGVCNSDRETWVIQALVKKDTHKITNQITHHPNEPLYTITTYPWYDPATYTMNHCD